MARPHTDRHENVTVDIGASANPPGFDQELTGLSAGEQKTFDVEYPADYAIQELAGTTVDYDVNVKAIRTRVAAGAGRRAREGSRDRSIRSTRCARRCAHDLEHEAQHEADREMRADLLRQLASRVTFDVPSSLVDREIDRRVEEFVRRLVEQQIDPTRTNVNWEEFREQQRDAAVESVRSALVLDEIARRDQVAATDEEMQSGDRPLRRAHGAYRRRRAGATGERGRAFTPLYRTAAGEDDGVAALEGDGAESVTITPSSS